MKSKFLILFCCLALASCCKKPPVMSSSISDSVSVERKTEYKEILRLDTVYIEIPEQSKSVVIRDSTSHLETDYAVSDAWITPDGFLYHSLANKPKSIPKPVFVKDTQKTDSLDKSKLHNETETKYIPAELSWWQRFWLRSGQVAWTIFLTTITVLIYLKRLKKINV